MKCNCKPNMYVDDYIGFTWNNIHSSHFNCFIENTGHLNFVGAPDFSNNFISPAFQTRTYYTGMQSSSKKLNFNLVLFDCTLADVNSALLWLDRSIISDFYFDYEPYWKYSCKLSNIGVMEKYITGRAQVNGRVHDLYLCRFTVTFETVYHPEAISAYTVYKNSEEGPQDHFSLWLNDRSILVDNSEIGVLNELIYSQTNNEGFLPYNELTTINNISVYKAKQLIQLSQENEMTKYWNITMHNPSSHQTFFKIHFYNVQGISVYQYWNGEGHIGTNGTDIDAYTNQLLIAHVDLNLDGDNVIDLHYNSEDGTILMCNQLIEAVKGISHHMLCNHKLGLANIGIPGTLDPDSPAEATFVIECLGKDAQIAIEYDTYEYTV